MVSAADLPPLPEYTLEHLPPLISGVPDNVLLVILPVAAYWIVSIAFHICDVYDLWPQYRLHTPEELLKRNHVSRYEVVRDVVIQQIIQTFTGLGIGMLDPAVMTGQQPYEVARWAQTIRRSQSLVPKILAIGGIDGMELSSQLAATHPLAAGFLAGGRYPQLTQTLTGPGAQTSLVPAFAMWEMSVAKFIYWLLIPAAQFAIAIFIVDTWQYFLHRAMHMNKWLYNTLHSRHHRLYVPYAFGALYNHPVEGFLLDILGAGIGHLVTGMTTRQAMWFFTCATIKTVDDHCGYAFPWDPLQHLTSNNAAYHDIHHQTWGIKTNFSQPFFTFWDRLLGTVWSGGDVSLRYERARNAARKVAKTESSDPGSAALMSTQSTPQQPAPQAVSSTPSGEPSPLKEPRFVADEKEAERDVRPKPNRSARRKTGSFDPKGEGLWGLRERIGNGLHGRSTAILHTDGRH